MHWGNCGFVKILVRLAAYCSLAWFVTCNWLKQAQIWQNGQWRPASFPARLLHIQIATEAMSLWRICGGVFYYKQGNSFILSPCMLLHEYGTAKNTLKLIHPCRKGQKMNNWENLYIKIYRQQDRLITEQQVNEANSLYELEQPPQDRNNST
jgi:hypothetical protein